MRATRLLLRLGRSIRYAVVSWLGASHRAHQAGLQPEYAMPADDVWPSLGGRKPDVARYSVRW